MAVIKDILSNNFNIVINKSGEIPPTSKEVISNSFNIIINKNSDTNEPPIIGNVSVSNTTSSGSYKLRYSVYDENIDNVAHMLKIDNDAFLPISPIHSQTYFTYQGKGLSLGNHTGYIKVTDGEFESTSSAFTISIKESTPGVKEDLRIAKEAYDFAHENLKNVINIVIEDGKFDTDSERSVLDSAFNDYNFAVVNYNEIHQKAIDYVYNKKNEDLKETINKEIVDLNFAIDNLGNVMDTVFKDGILTEAEKLSIKQHLLILSTKKIEIDKSYTTIYSNESLIDSEKVKLKSAYDSYVSAYNSLVSVINELLNKDGLIDSSDNDRLNNAFAQHNIKLGEYSVASNKALDAIAQHKAESESEKVDKKYAQIILDPETGIQSKVEHTYEQINGLNGIEQRLASAEENITPEGITQIVKDIQYIKDIEGNVTTNIENISKIDQKADSISLEVKGKVDGDSIISSINMSPESIKINASKVNITGFVTFSDLAGTGTTTINGSNIKTGTIDANLANIININASNIKTGTLNANLANIININASNITTGTLKGDFISGGVIEGTTLKTAAMTSQGGVWIQQNGIQIGGTSIRFGDGRFKIETNANTSYSSTGNMYLMPGMVGASASGSGIVSIDGKCNAREFNISSTGYMKYTSFYSPWSNSELLTYGIRLNGALMVGTSGGSTHFITSNGGKAMIYANYNTIYSVPNTQSIPYSNNAIDKINSATVVDNKIIPKINNINKDNILSDCVRFTEDSQVEMNMENTIALLWEAVQKQQDMINELTK